MSLFQTFTDSDRGEVIFIDRKHNYHSAFCQPRDIEIVTPVQLPEDERDRLREEIAVQIRLNQGMADVGVRKNLKWS